MANQENKTQKSEYEIQAEKFLEKNNLEVIFRLIGCDTPKWDESGQCHNHYKITIKRKASNAKLCFSWWDSIDATMKDEQPTAYDALTSLSADSYQYEDFKDFCDNLGYDTDSRKAFRTWKAYDKLSTKINDYFSSQELDELREIQ